MGSCTRTKASSSAWHGTTNVVEALVSPNKRQREYKTLLVLDSYIPDWDSGEDVEVVCSCATSKGNDVDGGSTIARAKKGTRSAVPMEKRIS